MHGLYRTPTVTQLQTTRRIVSAGEPTPKEREPTASHLALHAPNLKDSLPRRSPRTGVCDARFGVVLAPASGAFFAAAGVGLAEPTPSSATCTVDGASVCAAGALATATVAHDDQALYHLLLSSTDGRAEPEAGDAASASAARACTKPFHSVVHAAAAAASNTPGLVPPTGGVTICSAREYSCSSTSARFGGSPVSNAAQASALFMLASTAKTSADFLRWPSPRAVGVLRPRVVRDDEVLSTTRDRPRRLVPLPFTAELGFLVADLAATAFSLSSGAAGVAQRFVLLRVEMRGVVAPATLVVGMVLRPLLTPVVCAACHSKER